MRVQKILNKEKLMHSSLETIKPLDIFYDIKFETYYIEVEKNTDCIEITYQLSKEYLWFHKKIHRKNKSLMDINASGNIKNFIKENFGYSIQEFYDKAKLENIELIKLNFNIPDAFLKGMILKESNL